MAGVVKIHFSYANMLPGQGENAKSKSGGEDYGLKIMGYRPTQKNVQFHILNTES